MTKLIERIGKETLVDGKPIDLDNLVFSGTELIEPRCHHVSHGFSTRLNEQEIRDNAIKEASLLAQQYSCDYFMLGNRTVCVDDRAIYVASFFKIK